MCYEVLVMTGYFLTIKHDAHAKLGKAKHLDLLVEKRLADILPVELLG